MSFVTMKDVRPGFVVRCRSGGCCTGAFSESTFIVRRVNAQTQMLDLLELTRKVDDATELEMFPGDVTLICVLVPLHEGTNTMMTREELPEFPTWPEIERGADAIPSPWRTAIDRAGLWLD